MYILVCFLMNASSAHIRSPNATCMSICVNKFRNIKVIDGVDKGSDHKGMLGRHRKERVSPLNVSSADTHINHCDWMLKSTFDWFCPLIWSRHFITLGENQWADPAIYENTVKQNSFPSKNLGIWSPLSCLLGVNLKCHLECFVFCFFFTNPRDLFDTSIRARELAKPLSFF